LQIQAAAPGRCSDPANAPRAEAIWERPKEIEILLDIASKEKFLSRGLAAIFSHSIAQLLVLEQPNDPVSRFFN
jgi:hypothetical protein